MIKNPNHLRRVDVRAARRSLLHSIVNLALAAAAISLAVTDAEARAREISASSYGFTDSLLPNTGLEHLPILWLPGSDGALKCSVNCGSALGASVVQSSGMLTSNTADVSMRKATDSVGHTMGLAGMVVVERLEPDASGAPMNWVVVSERTIDENGSHSWSLMSGAPSNTPWLPNDLYRFEGSSLSVDLLGETPTTPEASTWVMMLIGFAGLGMAGHRNSKPSWRVIQTPKRSRSR